MKHSFFIILLFITSLTTNAQDEAYPEIGNFYKLIDKAWEYTVDVAPVFDYYIDNENIDDFIQLCLEDRSLLDSLYFATKEAEFSATDLANDGSDMGNSDLEYYALNAKDYLVEAQTEINNATNSLDMIFDEESPENIYSYLYQSEDYFVTARQLLKKAEKEIQKAQKKINK